jgi:seryl-tRNA synthetase
MTVDYDPRAFWDGLVAHRLVVPAAVPGIYGRGPRFEAVIAALDALITRAGADEGAEQLTFPPVLDRTILERTAYVESFPHLVGAVLSFTGREREAREMAQKVRDGQPWAQMLSLTGVALAPAACYSVYPTMRGVLPHGGRCVSLHGWAFRHEPSPEPTRAQAFRMREYVKLGSPEQCVAWRDRWHARGLSILESLGLPARSDVAADPFFGRGGQMMAASQVEQQLKFEVLVPVISADQPTACCSFNYHQDKFGAAFGIALDDGATAHTACLGFGMERVAMALFKHHGFSIEGWPPAVRARLWPEGA